MQTKGKILVMDDEETVCRLIEAVLSVLGYHVTCTGNGDEAVREYANAMKSRPFDVVVLDLTVPKGMGGRECLQHLRSIDPNVKAVVSTGYWNDPMVSDFSSYGFVGAILKPCTLEMMEKTLLEAMNR